ncbi:MAG: hypothetical protein WCJ36_00900 [Candidatus Saccharibacteria bacterium]
MTEQRLPIVNSDDGDWGNVLNQYLTKEHYNTGIDNTANGGHKSITLRPGTNTAGTAPLKFASGALLSSPEVGAVEYLTDAYYGTISTGTARKQFAFTDDVLKLDQTTPQIILNGAFKLDSLKSQLLLGTDSEGKIIGGSETDPLSLHLDQTVPQIVTNGTLDVQDESAKLFNLKRTNDVFNSIQFLVAPSTYTDITTLASTSGNITADVLNVVNDFFYVGKSTTFTGIFFDFYTIMSAGTNRTWEYSTGEGTWATLTIISDGTNQWQQDGVVTFNAPVGWNSATVNVTAGLYWIRVGTESGTFTTEPTLRLCLPSSATPGTVAEIYATKKRYITIHGH